MNQKTKKLLKLLFSKKISAAILTFVGLQSTALAAPGDFSFTKYSAFGEGENQCPFCDSTTSFTVYETIDNWTEELNLDPATLLGNTSGTEKYVLLYQVVNADTIFPGEDTLQHFFVSVNEGGGSYFGDNPYKSAGYIDSTVLNSASSAITPLDKPADGKVDSDLVFDGFKTLESAVSPTNIAYGEIFDDEVEAINGPSPTNGITFFFENPIPETDSDPMAPGGRGTSSLLFLTADENWFSENINSDQEIDLQYTWGRTQRFEGANGTSGDVVGVNVVEQQIPEPSTIVGLFAVSALGLTIKHKKQPKV